ncbi:MAG: hypothetical protein R3B35_04965 [Gemmatimonadales bacterium]
MRVEFQVVFAEPDLIHRGGRTVEAKMNACQELYPSDVYFIHRDAEAEPWRNRVVEIENAMRRNSHVLYVPVVPVRMQEAWLLANESGLRTAAGNPRGTNALHLPPLHSLEGIADPKAVLREALLSASGTTGRRRDRFDVERAADYLAELTTDYAPLLRFESFSAIDDDISRIARMRGWT